MLTSSDQQIVSANASIIFMGSRFTQRTKLDWSGNSETARLSRRNKLYFV
jgi:hypothetical protein